MHIFTGLLSFNIMFLLSANTKFLFSTFKASKMGHCDYNQKYLLWAQQPPCHLVKDRWF